MTANCRPVLYRVFDDTGRLIYVGQTVDIDRRISEHRSQAWWWRLLAHEVRVESQPDVQSAKAAEKVAIQEECPAFNSMGYGDWRDRPYWSAADRALYDAWHHAVIAEQRRGYANRAARRGMAARLAENARRRLQVVPA